MEILSLTVEEQLQQVIDEATRLLCSMIIIKETSEVESSNERYNGIRLSYHSLVWYDY